MPNKRIEMNKIKQVLRSYAAGYGTKTIGGMLCMSRNTVRKYLRISQALPYSIEEQMEMDDSTLNELFLGERKEEVLPERRKELDALLPDYARRLKRKGMTKRKLFEEYHASHPDGYSRSRFNLAMQAYMATSRPIAHLEHKAGDKMYVDYAGDKLSIVDAETGEIIPVEAFVAILPCSQLTYVEAVATQRKEDFIRSCENALWFYGGVPAVIVPDNLKAAVKRPSRYEAELTDDFAAFADHYGCVAIPARVRKPRDKALVEGAVKLIYRSVYPQVEEGAFTSLEALNTAIRTALELHNNAPMDGGRRQSRREQYEDVERPAMRPLPSTRFELRQRKSATVQKNGYVYVEQHYYSVPYKYIGKKVGILYDSHTVDVYYGYDKLATHVRSYHRYGYTTVMGHLASNCRAQAEWSPMGFITEAMKIDKSVGEYVKAVIDSRPHPEQAYKSCQGILSFARRVGEVRLTNACRLAASCGMYSYRAIETIIANKQDMLPPEEAMGEIQASIPRHENIRGKEYFE